MTTFEYMSIMLMVEKKIPILIPQYFKILTPIPTVKNTEK